MPTVTFAAGVQCLDLFENAPKIANLNESEVLTLQKTLTARMQDRSRELEKRLRTAQGPSVYNTVVVGGGLHGSIFAATAGQKGRGDNVLVIEASNVVSNVFGKMDGTFRINSPAQANTFPGSPIQQKDIASKPYATSLDLGTLATTAAYSSRADILFENPVVAITDMHWAQSKNDSPRYRVQTATGVVVYANELVLAPGLGKVSFPFKDAATIDLVEKAFAKNLESPNEYQPIMTVDTFLGMVKNNVVGAREQKAKFSLEAETHGKSIAVIGSGDGGKIAVEALTNRGPIPGNLNSSGKKVFADDLTVHWVGQSAKTPTEYKNSTWKRYFPIAKDIGGKIQTYDGYLQTIRQLPNGRFEIIYGDGARLEVDNIILATGYKNLVPSLMSNLNGELIEAANITMEPVVRNGTAIGSRVVVKDGPQQDVYVIGPGAGPIKTKEELSASRTGNPVSVENLGPGSSAMVEVATKPAQRLINLGAAQSTFAYSLNQINVKANASNDIDVLTVATKLELHRSLIGMSSNENITVGVTYKNDLSISGLDKASADLVYGKISANQELVSALKKIAQKTLGFKVQVPATEGVLRVDQAAIEVQ